MREVAELLELTDFLQRKPGQLSGGQRQRVAMGRAIVRQPSVYLMDEPLSNLDAKLRVQMRADIAALQARLGTTTVYVTHDQSEAMTLGNRVALLRDGFLQQFDTPRALYDRPANTFVAGVRRLARDEPRDRAARAERLRLARRGRRCRCPTARAQRAPSRGHGEVVVGLRPEALELAADGIPAEVELVEEIGADAHVFCVAELGGRADEARGPHECPGGAVARRARLVASQARRGAPLRPGLGRPARLTPAEDGSLTPRRPNCVEFCCFLPQKGDTGAAETLV